MEEDEIEAQASKLARVENGSDGNRNRFHSWHHSSRIIRVSRASGGKDRHSKVMTSKGLRDRRVRLSVSTAIQFYDLQDRLGYDQPSKAVEWLIKSAADAIAELPSLNSTYPPNCDEKGPSDEQEVDDENDANHPQTNNNTNQSQNISLSKSACSSNSETSKGSGLSLSRCANRVKARERARERTAKEKEKEKEPHNNVVHNVKPISQTVSFTELLTGGMNNAVPTTSSPNHNHAREQWSSSSSAPMDYLSSGLLGASSSSRTHHNHGFSASQIQLGHNSLPETMSFHSHNNSSYHNYSQLQQFSLMPAVADHQQQLVSANGNDDNLNFSISGYNRGTLQSNSPSLLPHFLDGSAVPFFIGTTPTIHYHHKFSTDHKGKTKN